MCLKQQQQHYRRINNATPTTTSTIQTYRRAGRSVGRLDGWLVRNETENNNENQLITDASPLRYRKILIDKIEEKNFNDHKINVN